METQKEIKQLRRLKIMREMESHRPLVVKSLDEQIKERESKNTNKNKQKNEKRL